MDFPLQHKRILITRSSEQAVGFSSKIKQLGGIPVVFPLIKFTAINTERLEQELTAVQFDWIIFTSPRAVHFFFEKSTLTNNKAKIAVVGSGTKKALEAQGVAVDFMPSKYTAKDLAIELPVVDGAHVFIPRSELAKNDIVELLEQRNCKVTTLSIYQNTAVKYSKKEVEDLNLDTIDFITFTSGSTVQSFVNNGLTPHTAKTICIGPETAKVAGKLNVRVDAIAKPYTIDGMIEELVVIARSEE